MTIFPPPKSARPSASLSQSASITSQILISLLTTDVVIDREQSDFAMTGLRVSSTLQLHRLITVSLSLLQRELGQLPPQLQADVATRLKFLFNLA